MTSIAAPPKAAQKQTFPPNQTLYVTNLNDKLSKPDLRRALYGLFATYGPVLDVVALKTMKGRGQAFIVYRDVQTSTQAMRALQAFDFFGKAMRISYGNGKSNMISKLDGTARIPETKPEAGVSTELQKSIFNAPPSSTIPPPTSAGLTKPTNGTVEAGIPGAQGTKRRRDDESEEEDVPMEEDDDAAMEESDED